jgi:CheY-like chemotaxis protein
MRTKPRVTSLKVKITVILAAVFAVAGTLAGFFIWNELNVKVREISRQKLVSIAQTTAALVDADEHERIMAENDEAYLNIREVFSKVVASNPGVDDIYTLRKTNKKNIWYFVATAYETQDADGDGKISPEEEKVAYGEEFDVSELPEMKKAFENPSADYETNCDIWGCWLSGYAPIVDSSGEAVAVLGVDISAEDIISYESQSFRVILFILLFLFVSFCLVVFLAFHILSRPASRIISGIDDFNCDINSRISVQSGDEFEMIAESFNMMANEFQKKFSKEAEKNNGEKKSCFVSNKKKVLIVEDEEVLQKTLKDDFEAHNFEVVATLDGADGLEKALSLHPRLIVLDILVPKLDGTAFLKKLREDSWGANASVMVLANISDYKKLEKALELGVDEYMIKADWNIKNVVERAKVILGTR